MIHYMYPSCTSYAALQSIYHDRLASNILHESVRYACNCECNHTDINILTVD
jgi:hypothetical protein